MSEVKISKCMLDKVKQANEKEKTEQEARNNTSKLKESKAIKKLLTMHTVSMNDKDITSLKKSEIPKDDIRGLRQPAKDECKKSVAESQNLDKIISQRIDDAESYVKNTSHIDLKNDLNAEDTICDISFGSKEKSDLEKRLANAESNLRRAEKRYEKLMNDKAHGWIGINPAISDCKFQIKTYSSEIEHLKRDIARIKE